jgi:hypothetical protein
MVYIFMKVVVTGLDPLSSIINKLLKKIRHSGPLSSLVLLCHHS